LGLKKTENLNDNYFYFKLPTVHSTPYEVREKVQMIENLIAENLPIGKTVPYRAYAMELLS